MELVWLVYAISTLGKVVAALSTLFFLLVLVAVLYSASLMYDYFTPEEIRIHASRLKKIIAGVLVMLTVLVFIPSEKTAYTMVAAYATQKVAERPETQELAGDVLVIINNKVKKYALESSEELEKYKKK